jgi:hypothetical protein
MKIGAGADQWLALGRDALQRPNNEAGAGCDARLAELRLDVLGRKLSAVSLEGLMRNTLQVITASHLSAFCLQSIENSGAAIGLDGQKRVGG